MCKQSGAFSSPHVRILGRLSKDRLEHIKLVQKAQRPRIHDDKPHENVRDGVSTARRIVLHRMTVAAVTSAITVVGSAVAAGVSMIVGLVEWVPDRLEYEPPSFRILADVEELASARQPNLLLNRRVKFYADGPPSN